MSDLPETLPNDLEAERAVLAAILLDPESLWRVLEVLTPAEMYSEAHRLILDAARDIGLNGSGAPDLVSMTAALRDRKLLERIGGASYLSSLVEALPDVANVEHYAGIVREMARRRQLIQIAQRTLTTATVGGVEADEIQRRLLGELTSLDNRRSIEQAWLSDAMRDEAGKVLTLHRQGAGALGLLTGIEGIDEILQGLKPEMYILAAQPRVGKSTLADQIGVHVAATTGQSVLCAFTEMSIQQRARRQIAAAIGVPMPRLQAGSLTPNERRALEKLTGSSARVRLLQVAGRTAAELRTLVLRYTAQHGKPALVIVDYLQQLRHANPRAGMNERTAEKSGQMRELAASLEVPVLVLSQLNRECEREKRPPRLSDLRESGELEQDAYAVLFLHRVDPKSPEQVVLIVAKHKDGPEGRCGLRFRPDRMCFEGSVHTRAAEVA